jgi:hypothetical protein
VLGRQLLECLPRAVVYLALHTPVDEQERFLAANQRPFEGPIAPACRCRSCAAAREHKAQLPPRAWLLRRDVATHLA